MGVSFITDVNMSDSLTTGGIITSSGIITAPGGNSSQWNAGYANSITGLAVTGSTTKTLTATQQDGGTLTASWSDDSGSNNYLNAVSWNSSTGVITFGREGLNSLTLDIDGRYVTSSGVTSVATGNGISGGTITGIGTLTVGAGDGLSQSSTGLLVDSTVVRTSGNQSISGSKSFNSTTNINADLDMEGGSDILLSASGRIAIDGDTGTAGQVLTSTGSAQNWSTPASGGITGSGTDNEIAFFNGTSAIESNAGLVVGGLGGELGIGGYVNHIGTSGSGAEKFGFALGGFVIQVGTFFQTFHAVTGGAVKLGYGNNGFKLETTSTGVEVTGIFNADKIAYTPVQFSVGFQDNPFGASPGTSIKLLNMSGGQGASSNVSSPQPGAYYVAPQAGRVKQIVLRNTKTVPTSHSTRIKIYKNGSNTFTSSYAAGTGTNAIGWYVDFDDIDHDFAQYDRIQIAFQGSNSNTNWENFNMTLVVQYEDYEY